MTASVDWLVVGGPVEPWRSLGLVAAPHGDGGGRIPLFGTGIDVTGEGDPGMRGLVLSGVGAELIAIDGVPVTVAEPGPPLFAEHPLGAVSIDHVVVVTDDLARTCGAVADATGVPLKRIREAGPIRQGFHRVGGLVVEVVEQRGLETGPALLWGFVLVVDDLDGLCERLGPDVIGEPRPAVQPGRSIATVRPEVGLGVALAVMTPDRRP